MDEGTPEPIPAETTDPNAAVPAQLAKTAESVSRLQILAAAAFALLTAGAGAAAFAGRLATKSDLRAAVDQASHGPPDVRVTRRLDAIESRQEVLDAQRTADHEAIVGGLNRVEEQQRQILNHLLRKR